MLKRILHEDEHLLVVNKPPGMNTHAPAPFAGEGLYDWLRHRERRWARLAIIHRLDKETSGVIVFGKTPEANRALTSQFAGRQVKKQYLMLVEKAPAKLPVTLTTCLVRAGERYVSRPSHPSGEKAVTRFKNAGMLNGRHCVEAEPQTGRTHQIRVHAASLGCPILGDTLYGGAPAPRLCLHAARLTLCHPVTGEEMTFAAPPEFDRNASPAIREMVVDPEETDAFRLIHGAADGWPGWYLDKIGGALLSQSEHPLTLDQRMRLDDIAAGLVREGVPPVCYHKLLDRHLRHHAPEEASPLPLASTTLPERFTAVENGVKYEFSFCEGYSVGLFFDQRDNRRRLLTGHLAANFTLADGGLVGRELLNTFAYTCGFSVCAAKAGMRTTSMDLSRNYLEWGRRNFTLNNIAPDGHDFIYGDVFDWMRRLAKKQRMFDAILLDPPTFSQSKEHGAFRAEKDYTLLVALALPLLKRDGVLFASTNAARLAPEGFLEMITTAIQASGRRILQQFYAPQPPDFPVSREEPAYLKTVWMRVS